MGTTSEVMEKIRKLLSLANSSNEHEAALAASRAAELMLKHQISEARLAVTTGEEKIEPVGEETMGEATRRIVHWRGSLASVLVEHFGCDYFWQWKNVSMPETRFRCECGYRFGSRADWKAHAAEVVWVRGQHSYCAPIQVPVPRRVTVLRIVGRPSSIQACSYLYAYLLKEIERLAEERYDPSRDERRMYTSPSAAARTWRESFRYGAISVIGQRFRAMREEVISAARASAKVTHTEANLSQALVKIDDRAAVAGFMKAKHPKMRSIRGSSSRITDAGYSAGQAAGREVNLGTGRAGLNAPARQLKR